MDTFPSLSMLAVREGNPLETCLGSLVEQGDSDRNDTQAAYKLMTGLLLR